MLRDFLGIAGESYKDFRVVKVTELKELNCILRELVHEPSGAQVMHVANDDPENLFCLSFKTYPKDSKGAAHILEHTVLCGSRKFPVKDPFFAMTRRSLNTFMNAMTGADFTCYPAASQVEKDFYNLLDVYIDAVFHPQLKEASFLQEGHRLEFASPKDTSSPLEHKGIVYNEMKGTMTSRDTRLINSMMGALCPDLTYAYNSGGDPKEIPDLSYQELIEFHETFYHPSRCLYFFYGNLPLKQHLDFIAEKALKNVPMEAPIPAIKRQPRFTKPVYAEDRFPLNPADDSKEKTMISFGWLTVPQEDQSTLLALSVLDAILMDNDSSLLKRQLLDSKLCIQASAYMDSEMSEVPYVIICKGCERENVNALQDVLFKAFESIAQNGIPQHLIEAAVHQLELARTEITGDSAPYGLTIFMRSALAKQHNCPPENSLLVHSLFEELLEKVKDPEYLPQLLRKYFLNNTHCVRLIMVPDKNLANEEAQREKEKLLVIQAHLTEEQKEKIVHQTEMLERYQTETDEQCVDCLPKVGIDDVGVIARDFHLQKEEFGTLKVFHHACFTNHIIYADLIFDLGDIPEEDLPYIQLFITFFSEVGVGERDYLANLEYIQAYTGGVGASTGLYVQATNPHAMKPCITIRGKALARNADKLFGLMKEMSTSTRFDEEGRIAELMQQLNSALQNKVNRNALRYAIQLSLSSFSAAGFVSEAWSGLKYYHTIRDLADNLEANLPIIIAKLTDLKVRLLCAKNPHLVLSCDAVDYKHLKENEFFGLGELPYHSINPWTGNYPLVATPSQGRIIASPVAFTCAAFKSVAYLHPHAPALATASHIMDNKTLHPKVRERGGAYGVGAHFGPMLGQFYFHSYRDPHIASTIGTFFEAIEVLARGELNATDLEEAKLSMVQQMDSPIAPGSRALAAYSWLREGKTKEMRQAYRDQVLSLDIKHIQRAVEEDLLSKKDTAVIVAFADRALLERENALLSSPLPLFEI